MVEVVIPSPGESITEVTLGTWRKSDGDWVEKDELLNEIDSDKATLELLSPASGAIRLVAKSGTEQKVGTLVARNCVGRLRDAARHRNAPPYLTMRVRDISISATIWRSHGRCMCVHLAHRSG